MTDVAPKAEGTGAGGGQADITPLLADTDDYVIDGISGALQASVSEEKTIGSLHSMQRDPKTHRQGIAVVILLAAFMSGAMSFVVVPLSIDFLHFTESLAMDLKYGVVFAFCPGVSLLFSVPAVWLGGMDSQSGGLSLLLIAFLLWTGSGLISVCASLVQGGRRYGAILLARALCGIASMCSMVSVLSLVSVLSNDRTQRKALLHSTLAALAGGQVFGLLLSGTASLRGILFGWQLSFCVLAVCAGLGVFAVAIMRSTLRKTNIPTQVFLPTLSILSEVPRNPLLLLLTINFVLVMIAASFCTVLVPIWMRKVFAPGPPSWTIAAVFVSRPVVFLGALMLKTVERSPLLMQWRVVAVSTLVLTLSCICWLIFASHTPPVPVLVLPLSVLGACVAIAEVNTFPVLAQVLGDHSDAHLGSLHFMHMLSAEFALFLGPLLATALFSQVGFEWTFYTLAILLGVFVPFLGILKSLENHVDVYHCSDSR